MKKETAIDFPISGKVGALDHTIKKLKQQYLQLWWETGSTLPTFFKSYHPKEQKQMEKEISLLVDNMLDYMAHYSPVEETEPEDMDFSEPISRARQYLEKLSHITGLHIDDTLGSELTRSTKVFIDKVNRFDPAMAPENIYKALRNIWVMNTLQIYFKLNIHCSNSMFAYSMLYPYTDNIIDDVSLAAAEKLRMKQNLKQRLEGTPYARASEMEKKIDALVSLIEGEFPRDRFPGVFQSLLGIYNAQVKSLMQQGRDIPPYVMNLAGITFEKGGTSVLADGYLIKGELDEAQEDFCFGLGTFLQLADDIQDMVTDQKNNHITLFSHVIGKYKPDALANKLFHYISAIVERGLADPALKDLKELIHRSFYFHIIEAVGKNRGWYSDGYIDHLQAHFPLRFSYLKKLRKKLNKVLLKQRKQTFKLDVISAGLMALGSRLYEH